MSFINTLRFIIKGKKSKSLIKEGWKVEYQYSHLTEFFDPVAMFAELNYKLIGVPVEARFQYQGSFSIGEDIWKENHDMHLKLSAKMIVLGFPLKINRYVKKLNNRPTTVYKMWYNQKPLAVWHKKYDFGRDYGTEVQNTFISTALDEKGLYKVKNWDANQILGQNGENESCLIEKFVHTHILVIHDITNFEILWEALKKRVIDWAIFKFQWESSCSMGLKF